MKVEFVGKEIKMKEVKITIEDEDSKVLISMKPEDEDKMTTTIEFEPEIAMKESPTDAQYIGIKFFEFLGKGI